MSSLSLPRVLQQRKTSLEQERENFEKTQVCDFFSFHLFAFVTYFHRKIERLFLFSYVSKMNIYS